MYKNTHTLCRDNQKEAQAAERLWQKGFSQGGDQDPNGHSDGTKIELFSLKVMCGGNQPPIINWPIPSLH